MKILCINITEDTESWRLSQQEFQRVGLEVERLSATVEDNRPLAFNKSVYRAMEKARSIGAPGIPYADHYESLLLFEDDVVFGHHPYVTNVPGSMLRIAMSALPSDFMTLHLGANIIGMDTTVWQMPTPYNNVLARLWNCWQSHATLYSAECVKYILDNFNPNVLDADNMIFDEWLRTNVLPMGRSYVMKPMIAYQRPRRSEIWNCDTDYTSCHKRGNEYLASL